MQETRFEGTLQWHGQSPDIAFDYDHFNRLATLSFAGGASVEASAASSFKGDDTLLNPETFMLASLMHCHFLTFMSIAAKSRAPIAAYSDSAVGTLAMKDGKTRFVEVTLRPKVRFANEADAAKLASLHEKAHQNCFMGNSVNFEIKVEPELG